MNTHESVIIIIAVLAVILVCLIVAFILLGRATTASPLT